MRSGPSPTFMGKYGKGKVEGTDLGSTAFPTPSPSRGWKMLGSQLRASNLPQTTPPQAAGSGSAGNFETAKTLLGQRSISECRTIPFQMCSLLLANKAGPNGGS